MVSHSTSDTIERLDMKSVVCYLMILYLSLTIGVSSSKPQPQPEQQPSEHIAEPSVTASSSKPESPLVTRQKTTARTDSQSMIDLQISPVAEVEYSMPRSSEQSSSAPASRRQSQLASENIENQSRRSSTSSQKSVKRRGKVMEETIVEFEECLEHVLAWLLEAEEQANSMKPIEKDNVELVKSLFKEHEMFMQSLTESQDGVGRVLRRGQQLLQKLDEEEASAIIAQLLMVNSKWERIREVAMSRQNQLQHCLNTVQIEQLESIRKWLDNMEEEIQNAPPLTLNQNEVEKLIDAHTVIQERIENEQKYKAIRKVARPCLLTLVINMCMSECVHRFLHQKYSEIVRALSTFVAVIDETDSHFSYENLEKLLQSVGQRWMSVCEWAEMRARQLDGLSELIARYTSAYRKILEWLDNWEAEQLHSKGPEIIN
ncbi:spectrin repeat-containing domain protein [Onchocerca flexuosa]|uniref:Spectrin repeat-containing domain protein n=1 Tax=Onchocerca flexuosa TaxID=387005 RepID=A0A238C5I4_9BILA|nr:spectrin repeat-containing domain protein [Onchocerca flexuosa]